MKPMVVDAGQYIIEPKDLWSSRVPAKLRDLAPKVVSMPDGGEGWAFEGGQWLRPLGLDAVAGMSPLDFKTHGTSYANIRKGGYDAKERLKDMDVDETDAACIFPTFGLDLRTIRDRELQLACVKAYNDGVWEWAQSGNGKRLHPMAIMPATGLDDAVAEAQRAAKAGFRGVIFSGWPGGADKPVPADDAFWGVLTDAGMALNLIRGGPVGNDRTPTAPQRYIGPNAKGVRAYEPAWEAKWVNYASSKNANMAFLILTGVMERFPKFQVSMIENGCGWLPLCGEIMDWNYRYAQFVGLKHLRQWPGEHVRQSVKATIHNERTAILSRADINKNALMWASHYPNSTTTWPSSRAALAQLLEGVSDEERDRVMHGNCAALYKLPAPQAAGAR